MATKVVRFGIISTAKIALNRHIPAAKAAKKAQITAISSRGDAKAREAAEKHGIAKWYGSYEALLKDPDIDAVINPLPNSMHCEWTIKAAEAGKHILCEKPLAVSTKEARQMIAAAKANNVVLVEAFTHRFNPHLRLARKLIAEGAIGTVTNLDAALTFPVAEPKGNVRFSKELAGGSMMDAGCYAVYAVRYAMSAEPVRAAGIAHDSGNWGVDTTFSGMLEFPGGAVARVGSSMEQPRRCDLTAYGTKGRLYIPDMFNDSGPVLVTIGDKTTTEATPAPDRFLVQLDEFSDCVSTGKKPEFPAEDALKQTAALIALYDAARSGKTVNVERV